MGSQQNFSKNAYLKYFTSINPKTYTALFTLHPQARRKEIFISPAKNIGSGHLYVRPNYWPAMAGSAVAVPPALNQSPLLKCILTKIECLFKPIEQLVEFSNIPARSLHLEQTISRNYYFGTI